MPPPPRPQPLPTLPSAPARKLAPHVESALGGPLQMKPREPAPSRPPAPHVQACLAAAAQAKGISPAVPPPAAHVRAALSATGAKGATAVAAQPRMDRRPAGPSSVARPQVAPLPRNAPPPGGSALQRAAAAAVPMDIADDGGLGFGGRRLPTGYGSVSLRASINGIDIGHAWSGATVYTKGAEHAEDHVIEYVQNLLVAQDFAAVARQLQPVDIEVMKSIESQGKMDVVISNLTTSPCSSRHGTSKQDPGCTEKLIEMKETYSNTTISITAAHYYQPAIPGAKAKSKKACEDMEKAGITVTITNP